MPHEEILHALFFLFSSDKNNCGISYFTSNSHRDMEVNSRKMTGKTGKISEGIFA